jgi:hypothetical protein
MPTIAALSRLDWTGIGREALQAGAASLANATRHRLPAPHAAAEISVDMTSDERATVSTADRAIVCRLLGAPSCPPTPHLAPMDHDRAMAGIIIASIVRAAAS